MRRDGVFQLFIRRNLGENVRRRDLYAAAGRQRLADFAHAVGQGGFQRRHQAGLVQGVAVHIVVLDVGVFFDLLRPSAEDVRRAPVQLALARGIGHGGEVVQVGRLFFFHAFDAEVRVSAGQLRAAGGNFGDGFQADVAPVVDFAPVGDLSGGFACRAHAHTGGNTCPGGAYVAPGTAAPSGNFSGDAHRERVKQADGGTAPVGGADDFVHICPGDEVAHFFQAQAGQSAACLCQLLQAVCDGGAPLADVAARARNRHPRAGASGGCRTHGSRQCRRHVPRRTGNGLRQGARVFEGVEDFVCALHLAERFHLRLCFVGARHGRNGGGVFEVVGYRLVAFAADFGGHAFPSRDELPVLLLCFRRQFVHAAFFGSGFFQLADLVVQSFKAFAPVELLKLRLPFYRCFQVAFVEEIAQPRKEVVAVFCQYAGLVGFVARRRFFFLLRTSPLACLAHFFQRGEGFHVVLRQGRKVQAATDGGGQDGEAGKALFQPVQAVQGAGVVVHKSRRGVGFLRDAAQLCRLIRVAVEGLQQVVAPGKRVL